MPLASLTGTTSLPQSRPQSRQHAGLTDSTLSQGPSPNISLNPSPSLSPQPRAPRQPRRAYTIAQESKDDKVHNEEWEDATDKVRNTYTILIFFKLILNIIADKKCANIFNQVIWKYIEQLIFLD